jgi:uncharacterized membrane protein YdcZ (DUF606 family)
VNPRTIGSIVLRGAIVALALGTAYIHFTLGGFQFMAAAVGYVGLTAAMVAPIKLARDARWLTRLALIGFAAGAIGAWFVQGHPIFFQAVAAKTIEVVLIGLVAIEEYADVGGPIAVVKRMFSLGSRLVGAGAAA